jgi:hypothetical protein
MEINVSKTRTFIPQWNGNETLPEDERISITYTALNIGARKQLLGMETIKFEYDRDGNPTGGFGEVGLFNKETAIRRVKPVIANLTAAGKPVANAEDLLGAPMELYGLVVEFGDHLEKELHRESPEKN